MSNLQASKRWAGPSCSPVKSFVVDGDPALYLLYGSTAGRIVLQSTQVGRYSTRHMLLN